MISSILFLSLCLSFVKLHWSGIIQLDDNNLESNPSNVYYFTQKVSHYDVFNDDTFQQRYYLNDSFYQQGGPLFVNLGGEGPEESRIIASGMYMVNEYAQKHKGLILDIECRFYGASVPYGSLELKNYEYLTTLEILADYATVIASIRDKYGCNGVMTFGESYSGSLAAWMRIKYPDVVDVGSISSSSPSIALVNFTEYLDGVVKVMTEKFPDCLDTIDKGLHSAFEMLQDPGTVPKFEKMFNICQPMTDNDKILFFQTAIGGMMGSNIQFGHYDIIDGICKILHSAQTPLEGMAELIKKGVCFDVSYEEEIELFKQTGMYPNNSFAAKRSWMWQTCTEFGYFQETNQNQPVFPNVLTFEYYDGKCKDIFGEEVYSPDVDWINLNFGGFDPVVTNVFYTRGSDDPISYLCTDMKNPKLLTYMIEGGTHCSDVHPWKEGSPKGIKVAQEKADEYISSWLLGRIN